MTSPRRPSRLPRRLVAGAVALTACALGAGALTATAPAGAAALVYDPLTGLKVKSVGPVVAIKVQNTKEARPQSGLPQADQIWVAEQEGGHTRFIAIYGSTYPKKVGPVRSGRETDLQVLPQFGKPGLAYAGADVPVAAVLAASPRTVDLGKDAVVAGTPIRSSAYGFDRTRVTPYNFYTNANVLRYWAAKGGATKPKPMGFVFGKPKAAGKAAKSLNIVWSSQTSMQAAWNTKLHAWVIYADKKIMIDRESKKPLTAKNIVVMRVNYSISKLDRSNYLVPILKTVGKGQAFVLRDGASWTGTWTRASLTAGTTLKDARGKAMTLTPGQTWVMLVPVGKSLTGKPVVLHSVTIR